MTMWANKGDRTTTMQWWGHNNDMTRAWDDDDLTMSRWAPSLPSPTPFFYSRNRAQTWQHHIMPHPMRPWMTSKHQPTTAHKRTRTTTSQNPPAPSPRLTNGSRRQELRWVLTSPPLFISLTKDSGSMLLSATWQPNDEWRWIFIIHHCVFYDTTVSTPFLCLSQCFPHSSLTQIPGGDVATKWWQTTFIIILYFMAPW